MLLTLYCSGRHFVRTCLHLQFFFFFFCSFHFGSFLASWLRFRLWTSMGCFFHSLIFGNVFKVQNKHKKRHQQCFCSRRLHLSLLVSQFYYWNCVVLINLFFFSLSLVVTNIEHCSFDLLSHATTMPLKASQSLCILQDDAAHCLCRN